MKTFFVQTTSRVRDYRDMFIEAETFEEARAIGERVSGARIWSCEEFVDPYNGDVFTEEFVKFLDSKTGTWH